MGDWWYLVFSEYSEGNKIHYRRSKNLYGPWEAPFDDAFDGRAYMQDVQHLMENEEYFLDGCQQESITMTRTHTCGEELSCHTVFQKEDGTLGVKTGEPDDGSIRWLERFI